MAQSGPLSKQNQAPAPLPPSVEDAYRTKCIQLKQRINEVEESNDAFRLRRLRLNRGILKIRLERAFLLEQLSKRAGGPAEESEGSPSPPPTPQEKPLRTKRGHRRIDYSVELANIAPRSPSSVTHEGVASVTNGDGAKRNGDGNASHKGKHTARNDSPSSVSLIQPKRPRNDSPSSMSRIQPKRPRNESPSSTSLAPPSTQPKRARSATGKERVASKAAQKEATPSFKASVSPAPAAKPTSRSNPYMLFCESKRDEYEKRHEEDPDFEVEKQMAKAWRGMKTEQRQPWFDAAPKKKGAWDKEASKAGVEKPEEVRRGSSKASDDAEQEREEHVEDDDDDDEGEDEERQDEEDREEEERAQKRSAKPRGFLAVNHHQN